MEHIVLIKNFPAEQLSHSASQIPKIFKNDILGRWALGNKTILESAFMPHHEEVFQLEEVSMSGSNLFLIYKIGSLCFYSTACLPFCEEVHKISLLQLRRLAWQYCHGVYMGFFNGRPLCHLRFEAFFSWGALGKSCARLAFHCCFLLLLRRLYTRKPESCTVLQITWWCPERLIIELPIIQEICRILKIIIRKF